MILGFAQSALSPAGPQAGSISSLWWLYHWVAVVIYVLVVAFTVIAVAKKRAPTDDVEPQINNDPNIERRITRVVSMLVGITIIILFVLLIGDFVSGRRLFAMTKEPGQRAIKITGHQWWWEVEYEDETASHTFNTANEIHIPVGVPIRFDLYSDDVIHSFWVPNLHGKKDLIPGHPTQIWLRADQPGTYDGQCAEFCGHQHAKMRFQIVAEDQETFDKWCENQRRAAREPTTEMEKRGRSVFLGSTCVSCHTIQGTTAGARLGPNLTHVGGKQRIAANSLPNDAPTLVEWIHDPQQFKPGVRMPQNNLGQDDLRALALYLQSLK